MEFLKKIMELVFLCRIAWSSVSAHWTAKLSSTWPISSTTATMSLLGPMKRSATSTTALTAGPTSSSPWRTAPPSPRRPTKTRRARNAGALSWCGSRRPTRPPVERRTRRTKTRKRTRNRPRVGPATAAAVGMAVGIARHAAAMCRRIATRLPPGRLMRRTMTTRRAIERRGIRLESRCTARIRHCWARWRQKCRRAVSHWLYQVWLLFCPLLVNFRIYVLYEPDLKVDFALPRSFTPCISPWIHFDSSNVDWSIFTLCRQVIDWLIDWFYFSNVLHVLRIRGVEQNVSNLQDMVKIWATLESVDDVADVLLNHKIKWRTEQHKLGTEYWHRPDVYTWTVINLPAGKCKKDKPVCGLALRVGDVGAVNRLVAKWNPYPGTNFCSPFQSDLLL